MLERITRTIQVDSQTSVTSVWVVPDDYARANGTALVLGHGAGAGMDHPFMTFFHEGVASGGVMGVKFNFPYMEAGRKVPDRTGMLEMTFRRVVENVRSDPLGPRHIFVGGKSMGGRMATHLAVQDSGLAGVVLLGYPLHPPRKPHRLRISHFPGIECPVLFLQGTRDPLCELDLLSEALSLITGPVELQVVEGGDHSLQVLRRSGRCNEEVLQETLQVILSWMDRVREKTSKET